jgi:hypothetical protein
MGPVLHVKSRTAPPSKTQEHTHGPGLRLLLPPPAPVAIGGGTHSRQRPSVHTVQQVQPTTPKVEMAAPASASNESAVGIDLGTTYSCVAIWRNDCGEVIVNGQGNRLTPSCVAFTSDTESLVGEGAVNQADRSPTKHRPR